MLIAVIARVGSSRLPRKPLLNLSDEGCSLERIFNSAKKAGLDNNIYVLTSDLEADNEIAELCDQLYIKYLRGDPQYVLSRLIQLAKKNQEEEFIYYLGSDSPLVDISFIKAIFSRFIYLNNTKIDLLTCYFPNTFPGGYEVNIVSTKWLKRIDMDMLHYSEREHCFNSLLLSSNRKKIINLQNNCDLSWLNFSLDTLDDLEYIKRIIKAGAKNNLNSILKTIIYNDELIKLTKNRINRKVYNSFISSPGMHKGIKDKINDQIEASFCYLGNNDFNQGIKKLKETHGLINSFLCNDDINQIYINAEDIFLDKELISLLKIFQRQLLSNGFSVIE